jgi:hypothetical protein
LPPTEPTKTPETTVAPVAAAAPQTTPAHNQPAPSFSEQYQAIKPHALPIVLEQPNITVVELKGRLLDMKLHKALGYRLETDVLSLLLKDLQGQWGAGELKPAEVTPDIQQVIDRMAANKTNPVERAVLAVRSDFSR